MAGKLNKELQEIQKLVELLGKDINRLTFERLTKDTKFAAQYARDLRDELNATIGETDSLSSGWRNIQDELTKGSQSLKDMNSSMGSLKSISEKLENIKNGITKADEKTLEKLQEQFKSEEKKIGSIRSNLSLTQETLKQKIKTGDISNAETDQLRKINIALGEATSIITRNNGLFEETRDTLDEIDNLNEEIDHKLGALPGLASGLDNILGKIGIKGIGFGKALEDAKKQAQESGDSTKIWSNYTSNLGKQFKNLLSPANLVLGAITLIIKSLSAIDKEAGEFAKGMNMSYNESLAVRNEMSQLAMDSGDVSLNSKDLTKNLQEVGKALGTNAKLNGEDLTTMTKLTHQAGFTADELMNIQKLSLVNGKTLEDNTKEILGGASAYAARNGIVVNEKDVLKEVNKSSKALQLSLGQNTQAIAESVVKAKQFGLNLEQAGQMAEKMLDFESSIEAELSAELLTGKNLNLERARQLSLEGDIAGAAAEIASQIGSAAEFGEMNVIQQQAMADAVGLSREALAASLIEREALAKIGAKDAEEARKKYDSLVSQFGVEEAQKRLGDEQLALQFEQQSSSERMADSTARLSEIFVMMTPMLETIGELMTTIGDIIGAIMIPVSLLFKFFGKIGTSISKMIGPLGKVGKLLKGLASLAIVYAAYKAYASLATIPIAGVPLGIAAAAAVTAAGFGLLGSIKDGIIDPKGGVIVSGEKGSIQLDKDDSIIAGTNLFDKNKSKSSPTSQSPSGGSSNIKIDMTQTNALLQQLINVIQTGGNVMLDGQKVGTALKLGSFKTQ
jgi:hypothetical protein